MSYLLFDKHYTRELIDVGYRDAAEQADAFEELVRSSRAEAPPLSVGTA